MTIEIGARSAGKRTEKKAMRKKKQDVEFFSHDMQRGGGGVGMDRQLKSLMLQGDAWICCVDAKQKSLGERKLSIRHPIQ
jgi:hypothetical protein